MKPLQTTLRCIRKDCPNKRNAKGLCQQHYLPLYWKVVMETTTWNELFKKKLAKRIKKDNSANLLKVLGINKGNIVSIVKGLQKCN